MKNTFKFNIMFFIGILGCASNESRPVSNIKKDNSDKLSVYNYLKPIDRYSVKYDTILPHCISCPNPNTLTNLLYGINFNLPIVKTNTKKTSILIEGSLIQVTYPDGYKISLEKIKIKDAFFDIFLSNVDRYGKVYYVVDKANQKIYRIQITDFLDTNSNKVIESLKIDCLNDSLIPFFSFYISSRTNKLHTSSIVDFVTSGVKIQSENTYIIDDFYKLTFGKINEILDNYKQNSLDSGTIKKTSILSGGSGYDIMESL